MEEEKKVVREATHTAQDGVQKQASSKQERDGGLEG